MRLFPVVCLLILHVSQGRDDDDDEPYDPYTTTDPKKREPSPCEVCKFFVNELRGRLDETAKSKAVIETGYSFDEKKRKKKPYKTSELRLTEALHEPHICEKILEYNVHAERKGSNRYAKGMSETFQTLHGLVNKGVKVDLGIPLDLWDEPSAEVRKMQRICFKLAESYEEQIEEWYYNYQDTENLMEYICRERYLKDMKWDDKCLDEVFVPKEEGEEEEEEPEEEKKEVDPKQAKRDKDKIDRLIAEQAEEQRLGHKGEMGGPEAEKKKKAKQKKQKKEKKQKKGENNAKDTEEKDTKDKKDKKEKRKKDKKGDPGHDMRDEL